MAFMKGGLALGLQALKQADALGGTFFTDAEGAAPACYLAFLAETWVHLRNMDKHLPIPPNLSRYVYERRQREHDYAAAADENTRQALLRADGESRREFDWKYRGDLEWAHKLMWMNVTPLQTVFKKFGLVDQARTLEQKRRRYCQTFMTLF